MATKRNKKNNQQHGEGAGNAGSKDLGDALAVDQDGQEEGNDGGPNLPAITDQQRELAQQAQSEFEKGNLQAASTTMSKLLALRNTDPKVLHNKVVVDFHLNGQRNLQELKEKLQTVSSMARIADMTDSIEDVDHAVLYFNQAVVHYHWRQYRAAIAILEKLYHFIEPIEESLARKILMLLTELYLCTHEPEAALSVILYIEKLLQNAGKNAAAAVLDGTGKSDPGAKGNDSANKGDSDRKEDPHDKLKPYVLQMKVQSLLMMKSMKNCKRELKSLSFYGQSARTVYVKCNFEYLRGNYKKASKILDTWQSANSGTPTMMVLYNNNLGCLNFHQRKHHLAAINLRRAIEENSRLVKESKEKSDKGGRPAQTVVMSRHHELLYNMGIVLLHCGKPEASFDCLLEAVQVFQVNPMLWLRLAECCIMYHRKNNEEDKQLSKRMEVVQDAVGSGVHRKLILGTGVRQQASSSDLVTFPSVKSLGFAALCLTNALRMLPEDPQTVNTGTDGDATDQNKTPEVQLTQITPANPLRQAEVENLRCSILTASAYVSLCINDPLQAWRFCQSLLKHPRLSGAQKYLGHLYMAEALVSLDKVATAIDNLNFNLANDISILPPEAKLDLEKLDKGEKGEQQEQSETTRGALYTWYPKDADKALAILEYNLATAHAIRGETDKAFKYLTESSKHFGLPLPAHLFYLKLYLDLMEGRRANAQKVLKDYFGHMTPNRPGNPAPSIQ